MEAADVAHLEEAQDVCHHNGLGREGSANDARDGLVRHVTGRLSRLALVLGRILQQQKTKLFNQSINYLIV